MAKSKVEKLYDKYAKEYAGDFAPVSFDTSRVAMEAADEITWSFILKYLPKRKAVSILDAGCGDGFWSEKLLKMGYCNLTLSDLSSKMLSEAEKRLSKYSKNASITYIKANIADMRGMPASSFDFVFSQYDPVGYCMRPAQAMRELARVAKPGAFISVMVDTKFRRVPELIEAGQVEEARRLLRTDISNDYFHPQVNFTYESLSAHFTAAGLYVLEVIGAPVFLHQVDDEVRLKMWKNRKARAALMKMEMENCTDRSLVNFAGHVQLIGKKKK
jgi:ubiquinone/menaquinone biosynthesis C-methylase UbiE